MTRLCLLCSLGWHTCDGWRRPVGLVAERCGCGWCARAYQNVTPAVPYSPPRQAPTAGVAHNSHQGQRKGKGSPVPARGRSTGERRQLGESVPVAPPTEKGSGAVPRMGAGSAFKPQ